MMRVIYAGTPEFAVPALESLVQSEHEVIAVYTQPDRAAGRGRKVQQSPVKECALRHNIRVMQPASLKSAEESAKLAALDADIMVVAAYGLILPIEILTSPKYGCINIHASLLPRWRGAAPIQRAILEGDSETGITIMQMDKGLDTGAMLATAALAIDPHWNAGELHDHLKFIGARLLIETMQKIETGMQNTSAQDDNLANYAERLTKDEARIDWTKSAEALSREIRAYSPWPVSFTHLDNKPVRIWRATPRLDLPADKPGCITGHDRYGVYVGCGENVLQITELQFVGKKICDAAQVFNARDLNSQCFV